MPGKIKLLRVLNEGEKLAPQKQIIYDHLLNEAGVDKEVDKDRFIQHLEESNKLTTSQTVARVFGYYLQAFVKEGIIENIKPEPAAKPAPTEGEKAEGEKTKAHKGKGAKSNSPADAEAKPEKQVSETAAA